MRFAKFNQLGTNAVIYVNPNKVITVYEHRGNTYIVLDTNDKDGVIAVTETIHEVANKLADAMNDD